jgi:hypothetical protein
VANTIRIKRSSSLSSPASLLAGEIAWSDVSDTLFIGKGSSVLEIGGPGTFAKINSPAFTGTPTAPTPASADNSTKLATTNFVRTSRLDQFAAPNLDVSFNSHKITDLATPTAPNDAVNKSYVDSVASGLDVKNSVRAGSVSNISLAGTQTVDGVALAVGDRVLVKAQTNGTENGIYVVASGAWTRAIDFDSNTDVTPGSFVFVEEGSTLADTGWVLNNDGVVDLGVTSLSFTQFSGNGSYLGSGAIALTGSVFSLTHSANTLRTSSNSLQVAGGVAGTLLTSAGPSNEATWSLLNLATSVSGILPVANGGTGVATLTGLVKANGTNAFEAAVPDVDYLTPNSVIDGGTY